MIRLSEEEFEEMVVRCYEGLPEGLLGYLQNLDIVVEEWPSEEVLADTGTGRADGLLGLYMGVPRLERGDDLPFLPDKITLYQRPIEGMCGTREEVAEEVRKTLLHEVGHYLGMDEEHLDRLGYS